MLRLLKKMSGANRKPKFFCESCGTEVKQNAKFCHHCGKFFSSVKCPSCGFSGDSPAFKSGCPMCGYAVLQNEKVGSQPDVSRNRHSTDPLPLWMYFVSIVLLVALVAFILIRK